MKISLNSNRVFIVKLLIPFAVVVGIILLMVCFSIVFGGVEAEDLSIFLIIMIIYEIIFISLILIAKFVVWKRYEFTENEIICFKRRTKVDIIEISDIISISYYQFKFRYIITIFAGALNEGGCWKLHIKMKDGVKKELCFFSVKDVKLLQEKLYGDLITMY